MGCWQLFLLPLMHADITHKQVQIKPSPGSRPSKWRSALPFPDRAAPRRAAGVKHPLLLPQRVQQVTAIFKEARTCISCAKGLPSACLKRDPICVMAQNRDGPGLHGLGRIFMYSVIRESGGKRLEGARRERGGWQSGWFHFSPTRVSV